MLRPAASIAVPVGEGDLSPHRNGSPPPQGVPRHATDRNIRPVVRPSSKKAGCYAACLLTIPHLHPAGAPERPGDELILTYAVLFLLTTAATTAASATSFIQSGAITGINTARAIALKAALSAMTFATAGL